MRVQEDVEQRGIGKYAYQESQNAEGDSDALTLHKLLETSFRIFSLFLPIHGDLHKLLELLLSITINLQGFTC